MENYKIDKTNLPLDELLLCDDEIKKVFQGKDYFTGTAIMAQLAKNIKELNETLKTQLHGKEVQVT